MQPISFAGTTFSSLGVSARFVRDLPGEARNPQWLARSGSPPILAGVSRPGRTVPVVFRQDNADDSAEDCLIRLLGALDPSDPTPRPLVCTLTLDDDADGVPDDAHTVSVDCVVGAYTWAVDELGINVVFHAAEDVWRETTDTTDGPNSLTVTGSFAATNDGEAPAYPQIRVAWTAQRNSGETADLGWKYRVLIPVANTGTRAWTDELIPINLGDTTGLTTAKALANGNDVRFRLDGRELPRQLQNWDTPLTFAVLPLTLGAGETANLEMVYGNPQAGDPRSDQMTLDTYAGTSLRGYAAWDLGADNGTATSGGATSVTDTGKTWVVNRWAGATVFLTGGANSGQLRRVVSNTATVLTVDRAFAGGNPAAGTTYAIWASGFVGWGGARTAGGGGLTLTDSSAAFPVNALTGGVVEVFSGLGSGATLYPITSNTATVVTSSATFPTLDATSFYRIWRWGFASWYVDQVEHSERFRGRHRLNRHQNPPSRVWFRSDGIPGAWDRVLTKPNADDFRQVKWFTVDVGGGDNDYFPVLHVRRKRGSEDTYDEEGIADGMAYSSPLGIRGVRFDYDYLNEDGVGKVVLLSKAPGGEAWAIEHQTTTTQSSLTALALAYVDLTPVEGDLPIHVAQAVWPADEVEIPDTEDRNSEATVQDDETVEVYLDTASVSIDGAIPSAYEVDYGDEEDVYDLQATIAYGASVAAATHLVRIGRHAGLDDDGEGGGWFHLPDGDVLVIDCAAGEIFTYTGSISASSYTEEHAAHAAVVYERVADPDNPGALVAVTSSDWMPLPPGNTTVQVEETGLGTLEVYLVYAEGYHV